MSFTLILLLAGLLGIVLLVGAVIANALSKKNHE